MDFIIVVGIGAILVATGVITPKPKDEDVAEVKVDKTEKVCPIKAGTELAIVNKSGSPEPDKSSDKK